MLSCLCESLGCLCLSGTERGVFRSFVCLIVGNRFVCSVGVLGPTIMNELLLPSPSSELFVVLLRCCRVVLLSFPLHIFLEVWEFVFLVCLLLSRILLFLMFGFSIGISVMCMVGADGLPSSLYMVCIANHIDLAKTNRRICIRLVVDVLNKLCVRNRVFLVT